VDPEEPPNEEKVLVIYEGNNSGTLLLDNHGRQMNAGAPFEMTRVELRHLREQFPWHRFHEVKD